MKKSIFLGCMLAIATSVCGQNAVLSNGWQEIQPKEVTTNPVSLFDDWIVLAVNNDDKPNAMLLTMGTMGVFRGKPIVSIFVNESRYTYEQSINFRTLAIKEICNGFLLRKCRKKNHQVLNIFG